MLIPPRTLTQILGVWKERFAHTIGPIVVVSSDGDGVRRRLLHDFTSSVESEMFAEFDLVDDATSTDGVVQCFDLKHNLKRLRTRDLSKRGVKISPDALALNCDSYPELFGWYDGKPKETYRTLFNVDDRYVYFSSRRIGGRFGTFLSCGYVCVCTAVGSASRTTATQHHMSSMCDVLHLCAFAQVCLFAFSCCIVLSVT